MNNFLLSKSMDANWTFFCIVTQAIKSKLKLFLLMGIFLTTNLIITGCGQGGRRLIGKMGGGKPGNDKFICADPDTDSVCGMKYLVPGQSVKGKIRDKDWTSDFGRAYLTRIGGVDYFKITLWNDKLQNEDPCVEDLKIPHGYMTFLVKAQVGKYTLAAANKYPSIEFSEGANATWTTKAQVGTIEISKTIKGQKGRIRGSIVSSIDNGTSEKTSVTGLFVVKDCSEAGGGAEKPAEPEVPPANPPENPPTPTPSPNPTPTPMPADPPEGGN